MKTDRELLEAAASASGITASPDGYHHADGLVWIKRTDGVRRETRWNPLTDDGDALRLAVTLGIGIEAVERYAVANVRYGDTHCEAFGADPFAATRRAIVRAAATMADVKAVGAA